MMLNMTMCSVPIPTTTRADRQNERISASKNSWIVFRSEPNLWRRRRWARLRKCFWMDMFSMTMEYDISFSSFSIKKNCRLRVTRSRKRLCTKWWRSPQPFRGLSWKVEYLLVYFSLIWILSGRLKDRSNVANWLMEQKDVMPRLNARVLDAPTTKNYLDLTANTRKTSFPFLKHVLSWDLW